MNSMSKVFFCRVKPPMLRVPCLPATRRLSWSRYKWRKEQADNIWRDLGLVSLVSAIVSAVAFTRSNVGSAADISHPSVSKVEVSPKPSDSIRLIFLGTGSSMGNPLGKCLLDPAWKNAGHCRCSKLAVLDRPDCCRNYRCNPCLVVQVPSQDGDDDKHILIDCGKHFRESMVRWTPRYGVTGFDAIVLTHSHAHAILGLDDIRLVEGNRKNIPTYVSQQHFGAVESVFKYLVGQPTNLNATPDAEKPEGEEMSNADQKTLAPILFEAFDSFEPVSSMKFSAIPLQTRTNSVSFGFIFAGVAYLPCVSNISEETLQKLCELDIQLLIIEAFAERSTSSHLSLAEAIDVIEAIGPKRALLTGIGAEMEHVETNRILRKKFVAKGGIDIQLAHDGLAVDLEWLPENSSDSD